LWHFPVDAGFFLTGVFRFIDESSDRLKLFVVNPIFGGLCGSLNGISVPMSAKNMAINPSPKHKIVRIYRLPATGCRLPRMPAGA
jgi:hypothetical protein